MFSLLTQTKTWALISKQNYLFRFLFKFLNKYMNFDIVCMMDFSWVMYVECHVGWPSSWESSKFINEKKSKSCFR
jgi:hypothetical protein